ncbi:MAG: hypothetical protein PHN49_00055 [Candidatus Omnitrophica bacterium]|nr:hypothetical protein [Candidatus Omnitrophota bacterium]MDD5670014.1 hypothetical protein [Candidatus Omnitrophota bacterium]
MNKKLFLLLALLLLTPATFAFQTWQRPFQPVAPTDFTALAPHPIDSNQILVAANNQVYSRNPNGRWRLLWKTSGQNQKIHTLLSFREMPDWIFGLTDDGAFLGNLADGQWTTIYRSENGNEKAVLSFGIFPDSRNHWLLGTENGLFESADAGKTWARFKYLPERAAFPLIRFGNRVLFIATRNDLFISRDCMNFEMIFSLSGENASIPEENEAPSDQESDTDAIKPLRHLAAMAFSENTEALWIGTARGVFENHGGTKHWRRLPSHGLRNVKITYLAYAEKSGCLFAGAVTGIYLYRPGEKRWEELFQGLTDTKPRGIIVTHAPQDSGEQLLAITEDGLLQLPVPFGPPGEVQVSTPNLPSAERLQLFYRLLQLEPTVREIQRAVIRYANLSSGKIKRWHAASRLQALLPTFSFGKDFSSSNSIDIDRGGTADPDRYIIGPENTDNGWDADVSWNLGDMIWSSNQTSIDNREKLMVELRNDFLSEATRTYYERRRLQMDIVFAPVSSEAEFLEKLIRMDELTALLDAMTNGLLSKRLRELYQTHPELQSLWAPMENNEET